jgi:hypothetical protein
LTGLYVASANEAYRPRSRHPDSGQTGVLGSPYFQGRQRPDPVASAVSAPVFLFCIFVIGGARAFSWLFGYDDEMKIWAAQKPVACSDRIGTFGYHVCDVRLARRG